MFRYPLHTRRFHDWATSCCMCIRIRRPRRLFGITRAALILSGDRTDFVGLVEWLRSLKDLNSGRV